MVERVEPHASELFPSNYASWRYCIEVKCGVPLSAEYVAQRVGVLADPAHQETMRFVRLYGDGWRLTVLAWFQRAAAEG